MSSNTKQEELRNKLLDTPIKIKDPNGDIDTTYRKIGVEWLIDNLLPTINSEVTSVLDELENKRLDFGDEIAFVDILESAIQSIRSRYE